MNKTIYIKAPQCIQMNNPDVTLGDFLTIYSEDQEQKEKVSALPFYQFPPDQKSQLVVSVLKIIEYITTHFPDTDIENLGEGDFVLAYEPEKKSKKIKEKIYMFFICMIAFFGGGYAIMAYNTDVGAKELFTNLSMLFLGNPKTGVLALTIAYAIGLTVGMILFFNHFGNKKLTSDPTPLEIQMRLYEKDISTTVIKDMSRRGESLDVN